MEEIWKDVVGYENIYEVSNFGNVRTHENKTTWTERHGLRHWKQRYLKNKTPNGRDVRVSLWKNGKVKDWLVHRLVAHTFIPNTDETKNSINHIDGNPKNNHVSNLEWCDHYENNNHAFDNNLIKTGKKTTLLRLSDNKTFEFRSLSKANLFLGRSNGYIGNKLKRNKEQFTDKEGNLYKITWGFSPSFIIKYFTFTVKHNIMYI